jgi:hypothetical protein
MINFKNLAIVLLIFSNQVVYGQTQIMFGNPTTIDNMQLKERASAPSVPANAAAIFASLYAGRPMIGQVSDTGHRYFYQPLMGLGNVTMTAWSFNGAGASNLAGGGVAYEDVDNLANNALAMGANQGGEITSIFTQHKRARLVSAAATNSPAGVRSSGGMAMLGNTPGEGGFFLVFQFGISTTQTGARGFAGLIELSDIPNSTAISALTDCIGFAFDNQTTWRVISNDASGNSVQHADLGANFPTTTSSDGWLTFSLYAPSNQASYVYYHAKRVDNSGNVYQASGIINSDLPTAETLMNWHMWANTGTATTAVNFDMGSVYLETEN